MKQAICALGLALTLAATAGWAQGQGGGQGRPGGGRGGFGGGFGGTTFLLRMPEVQAELKVDDAQKELLQAVSEEAGQKMRALFEANRGNNNGGQGGGFSPELQQKMQALQADQSKKVAEILDAKQMARLKQLGIQRAGTGALGQEEVATQLKLTADQKSKIQAQQQAFGESLRGLFQRPQDGQRPTDAEREASRKKFEDARAANDAKLLGILTDAQKTQFKALQGAPFKFPEGGGFGGGRTRGRGNNNN